MPPRRRSEANAAIDNHAGGVDEITFKKRLRWRSVGAALRAFTDRVDLNWHQRLVNIVAPASTPMSKHRDWCPARLQAA